MLVMTIIYLFLPGFPPLEMMKCPEDNQFILKHFSYMKNYIKCQIKANQHTHLAGNCPGIELNGQSFEIVETFHLGDTTETRVGAFDIVIKRIRSGWSKHC